MECSTPPFMSEVVMEQPFKLILKREAKNVLHKSPAPKECAARFNAGVFLDAVAAKEVIANGTACGCGACFPSGGI